MHTNQQPIGIIDSGIGGYSVARQVRRLLPNEDLIYFGDGANTPYGNHSSQEILTLTHSMLSFMARQDIKALLVACNTISCLIDEYRNDLPCPIFSVVQAGADAVAGMNVHKVGVVSTVFTHMSGCYPRLIHLTAPHVEVVSRGCPNLANLVEHFLGDPAGDALLTDELQTCLGSLVEEQIDCCVLGCTHFPLVEPQIHRLFPQLPLVDPARQMAVSLDRYLEGCRLKNSHQHTGHLDIYTTGSAQDYAGKAKRAGLDPVTSVHHYPARDLTYPSM